MTMVKWSDGEAAWEQALNDYAKTLAESDPQSAAELLAGAAGGADAARAAANIALLSDAADQLATLTSDPDVFARAADLSSQCIGRVFIALDAINAELVEIAPSSFRLISEHSGFLDAEPPTKPVLTDYQAAVLWCAASGYENEEIAALRNPQVTPRAIRDTLGHCRERLGARTDRHAVAIAFRGGEFSHHRPRADHLMNRSANRTREQISQARFVEDVYREQMQMRADGEFKTLYDGRGDARSHNPINDATGEASVAELQPDEIPANPGIDRDDYHRHQTKQERHAADGPNDRRIAFGTTHTPRGALPKRKKHSKG